MGWNDHVNWELKDAVDDLIDEGLLIEGTPAHGIAQVVINQGLESLTNKQQKAWKKYVEAPLAMRHRQLEIQRVIDSNPE